MKIQLFLALAITFLTSLTIALAQGRELSLNGEVRDSHGDAIVNVHVFLKTPDKVERETLVDERGRFQFAALHSGSYTLRAVAEGFGTYEKTLKLEASSAALKIVLYPTIRDAITIEESAISVALDPANAGGAQLLKAKELESLPDDPDQFAEQLKLLATSSGSAPGQAVVTVDGFTVGGRMPPKSAIREVRINPDLYSAEYDKAPYQGGRIQILTRPGIDVFNGSAFYSYNNSVLNARDPFAAVRAPANTARYGFQLGGPLIKKKSGFFLDFERREINEFAAVNAVILDRDLQPSSFRTNVSTPRRLSIGSARVDWQATPLHTLIARYDVNQDRADNQGVGGFNLPDRASSLEATEQSVRLSATSLINTKSVNEARIGLTRLSISENAGSTAPAISVLGAFTSGGSSTQLQEKRDWRVEIVDNFSIAKGKHNLKIGGQLLGKQIDDDRRDLFNGLFTFGGGLAPQLDANGEVLSGPAGPILQNISGLEQYRRMLLGLPGGTPTRLTVSQGDSAVGVSQWTAAGYLQDEWHLQQSLSLSLGLRYEAQSRPLDRVSIAPRIGIAFSPDKKGTWVLRARAGIFYDRISETIPLETDRLDGAHIRHVIIDSPSFPHPFEGGSAREAIPTIRAIEDGIRPPGSFQAQVGVEHQFPLGWKLQISHSWSSAWGNLRSRNINAPILDGMADPAAAPRPLGSAQNILQFESSGRLRGQVLFIGLNQSRNKYFNLYSGYLLFDFHSDTDSSLATPQSSYRLAGEWARPSWQSRHRVFMTAILNLPWKLKAASTFSAASGTPFNITAGRDNNGDGIFNDRPALASPNSPNSVATKYGSFDAAAVNGDVPRNAGTNPSVATLDLNVSRLFQFGSATPPDAARGAGSGRNEGRYRITIQVRASNLLNRTNPVGLNGVLASPFFGRANIAQPARRIETGLRFTF